MKSQEIVVESYPIEKLVPYQRNPRKNDRAVGRMIASIQEFGFKIPILARSNGEVVDGHLRLKAAQKLGSRELPVVPCDEWSEAQVKAFRLMVNRSASWADLGPRAGSPRDSRPQDSGFRSRSDRLRADRDRSFPARRLDVVLGRRGDSGLLPESRDPGR